MSTDTVSASRRVQKKGQEGRGDAVLLGGVSQGRGRGGGMDGKQAFFSRKVDGGPAIGKAARSCDLPGLSGGTRSSPSSESTPDLAAMG